MTIRGELATRRVWIGDRELLLDRSQAIRNHSPDGFCWGYAGSGPAQLALALMLEYCNDDEEAQRYYQDFKFEIIAKLPASDFTIDELSVTGWVANRRVKETEEDPGLWSAQGDWR